MSISLVHLIQLCRSYYLSLSPPCPYPDFFDSIAGSHVHIFLCLSTRVWVFVVKDGSRHAVNSIQQMSNALFPCELHEIVHAKAEVIEESAKIDMLLKANRVDKEQKRKSLGTQEQRPNHFKGSRKRCLLHVATKRHNKNKTHCNGNLVATKHGWTLSLLVPTIWPRTPAESKQCLLKMRRSSQIVNTRSIAIKELFSTAVL